MVHPHRRNRITTNGIVTLYSQSGNTVSCFSITNTSGFALSLR